MYDCHQLKAKIAQHEPIITGMTRFHDSVFAGIMASSGYDAVIIDDEHFAFDDDDCMEILRAVHAGGASCLMRISEKREDKVSHALDMGMDGIYVSNVDTPAEARTVVDAARTSVSFDSNTTVFLMIESKEGLQNLDSILAVGGIDVIAVGPSDFSGSFGTPGIHTQQVCEAMETVYVKSRTKGIICETSVGSISDIEEGLRKEDVSFYCDSDLQMLVKQLRKRIRRTHDVEPLSERLAKRIPLQALVCLAAEPAVAEISVLSGVDVVIADTMHGWFTERDIADFARAAHAHGGACLLAISPEDEASTKRYVHIPVDGYFFASEEDARRCIKNFSLFHDVLVCYPSLSEDSSVPLFSVWGYQGLRGEVIGDDVHVLQEGLNASICAIKKACKGGTL